MNWQRFTIVLFGLASLISNGQANTEIYLFDLELSDGNPVLSNPKNISNNDGYDNQPSFWDNNTILFSSNRSGQTDIRQHKIEEGGITSWLNDTPTGSEYSPLKIPGKNAISSIRLDLDGLQRLYSYDIKTGKSKPINSLKIGYHVWFSENILISTVLMDGRLDLVVSNLKDQTNKTYQKNVGRSLLKIPNTNLISYISKEGKTWTIKSLDPVSGATSVIAPVYKNQEDICWLENGYLLTGHKKSLLRFDPKSNEGWKPLMQFQQEEINNISRIAVNAKGNRLAFVAEESPVTIVQKQLDAYNARDIDAFLETYSKDVEVYNFPNKLSFKGIEKMEANYAPFFEKTPDLHCEIKNRIVIGNKVIDEEYVTVNGSNFSAVAIYEVENGKIVKVTFVK